MSTAFSCAKRHSWEKIALEGPLAHMSGPIQEPAALRVRGRDRDMYHRRLTPEGDTGVGTSIPPLLGCADPLVGISVNLVTCGGGVRRPPVLRGLRARGGRSWLISRALCGGGRRWGDECRGRSDDRSVREGMLPARSSRLWTGVLDSTPVLPGEPPTAH
jgi:hypothetical protein